MDTGSLDIGSIHWTIDVGGPGIVNPFNIQRVIWLQDGGDGAIGRDGAVPCNRDISVAVDGGRNQKTFTSEATQTEDPNTSHKIQIDR